MDDSFLTILSVTTAKITATATEWKAFLRLLPPAPEARPILRKTADGARFFEYARLTKDYLGARILVESCAANRRVGGTCVFNVGHRAALTFVLSAHTGTLTRAQKNIVSAVLLKAEEICGPVNDMLYDIAVNSDPKRAGDIGLDAVMSAQQLSGDISCQMIDRNKTKEIVREMKAAHSFSKSEATQLSILVDRVTDIKADEAIQRAQSLATEITKKGLAVQKFVGFLKGAKELP